METALIKHDEILSQLTEAGLDLNEELDLSSKIDIPRIRIEHKNNGKHRMYIDHGENYLGIDSQEETIPDNRFKAVVFSEQEIRALWEEGESLPKCSAVNGIPTVEEPINPQCNGCPESVIGEGNCKPKVRLWLLTEHEDVIKPFVLALSPTSIKHWRSHKRKLQRSRLPVIAVNTIFTLEDVKKNSYRWAEVTFDVDGIPDKPMLIKAKEAREELNRIMGKITDSDFTEPGDKLPF